MAAPAAAATAAATAVRYPFSRLGGGVWGVRDALAESVEPMAPWIEMSVGRSPAYAALLGVPGWSCTQRVTLLTNAFRSAGREYARSTLFKLSLSSTLPLRGCRVRFRGREHSTPATRVLITLDIRLVFSSQREERCY